MRILRIGLSLILILVLHLKGFGQGEKLHYWRDIPGFLEAQTTAISEELQKVLHDNPPVLKPGSARKLALYSIDGLLHDTRIDSAIALRQFLKDRMKLVLDAFQKPAPAKGMQVFKLYNQGFLVRTASVTIGFDLVMANTKQGALIDSAQMASIADVCDVLLVSHIHGDHADVKVAKMFADRRKMVFTPSGMWENISDYIQPLRGDTVMSKRVSLPSGAFVDIKAFPGHQDETVLNNVYCVATPENYRIMHTGDQYNKRDLGWLDRVHETEKVDLLLLHNWIHHIERVVKGIAPKLVISGHENEMAHTIDHREPYWLTFRRMKNIPAPFLVMAWGEQYRIR